MKAPLAVVLVLALTGCQRGPPGSAKLDPLNDACAHCRMAVSDPRFAAQVVAPREEPRFFDDLGCLRDWLREHPRLPRGAVAFVADHRTGAWVRAARAVYARVPGLATPMGSGLVAHADGASREADRAVAEAIPVAATELFGPAGLPDGRP
jgi:copper chaperone NosL